MKKKFACEIDCANCAQKVEDAIRKLDGVVDVKVNFLMQNFTLEAEDASFEQVLDAAIRAGQRVEADFTVAR